MKTYLFESFNRYKRFSRELDAQTILCNKSWWLFNDSGEKKLYIFNTDGSLIISISGKVTNATWRFITANSSIIITGNNQSYMVHPAFYDDTIFALKVDGTEEYAFFIDENKLTSTNLRTLNDLIIYFQEKEKQHILGNNNVGKSDAEGNDNIEKVIKKNATQKLSTWYVIYEFVMVVIFSSAIICGVIRLFLWLNNNDTISGTVVDIISDVLRLLFTLWVKISDD